MRLRCADDREMATVNPPFRAEHIGSLKRPQVLLSKRQAMEQGKASKAELKQLEDKEIKRIVEMQQKLGFKAITDGEYRRHMFYDGFFDKLQGMSFVQQCDPAILKDYVPDVAAFKAQGFHGADTYLCTGKIKRTKPCYVDDFLYLKGLVGAEHVKMTMAAPEWFHLRHGEYAYDHNVYSTDAEYFADIGKAYAEELQAL